MGEHLPCKQGVRSSNLLVSTIRKKCLFFENWIMENNFTWLVKLLRA